MVGMDGGCTETYKIVKKSPLFIELKESRALRIKLFFLLLHVTIRCSPFLVIPDLELFSLTLLLKKLCFPFLGPLQLI